MLTECLESEEYAAGFKTKGPRDFSELLFMALIFQQHHLTYPNQELRSLRLFLTIKSKTANTSNKNR